MIAIAFILFAAIKFFAYVYFAKKIKSAYDDISEVDPMEFAIARLLLGVVLGLILALAFGGAQDFWAWYVALLPVRLIAWGAVIGIYFEKKSAKLNVKRLTILSIYGCVLSYLIDLPAALSGLLASGLKFVC